MLECSFEVFSLSSTVSNRFQWLNKSFQTGFFSGEDSPQEALFKSCSSSKLELQIEKVQRVIATKKLADSLAADQEPH